MQRIPKLIHRQCCFCDLSGRYFLQNLVEEEIWVELGLGEVVAAAGAVALVAEVRDDAHVAEAVAAGGEEGVLDDGHADRAEEVPVGGALPLRVRPLRRRRRGARPRLLHQRQRRRRGCGGVSGRRGLRLGHGRHERAGHRGVPHGAVGGGGGSGVRGGGSRGVGGGGRVGGGAVREYAVGDGSGTLGEGDRSGTLVGQSGEADRIFFK